MDLTWLQALAAVASAVAAVASAIAAVRGPRKAAEETIRLQNEKEQRDRRFQVFLILMAHRQNYGQQLAMQHLNVIDVLWLENRSVRNAWAKFFDSIKRDGFTQTQKEERFLSLLNEISSDLGFGNGLTQDDLIRSYYSTGQAVRENAEFSQNRLMLAHAEKALNEMQQNEPPEGRLDKAQ